MQESESLINEHAAKEWFEHKKYKSIGSITKTINFLKEYDFATQQKIVDTSIMNNYQGLFEPKQTNQQQSFKQQDKEQRDREFEAMSKHNIFDIIDAMEHNPDEPIQGVICE